MKQSEIHVLGHRSITVASCFLLFLTQICLDEAQMVESTTAKVSLFLCFNNFFLPKRGVQCPILCTEGTVRVVCLSLYIYFLIFYFSLLCFILH